MCVCVAPGSLWYYIILMFLVQHVQWSYHQANSNHESHTHTGALPPFLPSFLPSITLKASLISLSVCLGVSCVRVSECRLNSLNPAQWAQTRTHKEREREWVKKREREFCIREGWVFSSRGAELQSRQPGAIAAALSVSPSASPPPACIPFWTRHPVQWNRLRARSCMWLCERACALVCHSWNK